MLQRGRLMFTLSAGALVLVLAATLGRLPPRVASHFDARGMANGWSSRPVYALFVLLIGIIIPLSITGLIRVLTGSGVSALNMPSREYWMRPEHTQEGVRRVRAYMWWLACVLVMTALAIHWSVLVANGREPPELRMGEFFAVLGMVVFALGSWTVGWYRLLRPSRDGR